MAWPAAGPLLGGCDRPHLVALGFDIKPPVRRQRDCPLYGALPDVQRRRHALDYPGLALFSLGVSALLIGIMEAGRVGRWSGLDVLLPLGVAVVTLGAFLVVERRVREPIVPLRLFRHRMVVAASLTGFLSGMAMFGAISFVPLYLQGVSGMSATAAGFVLTPFVLGWVADVGPLAGAAACVRLPSCRVGMACMAVAFLMRAAGAEATQAGRCRPMLGGIGWIDVRANAVAVRVRCRDPILEPPRR